MSETVIEAMGILTWVAEIPDKDQRKIRKCAEKIKETVALFGKHGEAALALACAERTLEEAERRHVDTQPVPG